MLAHEMVLAFQYDIVARGKAGNGLQALAQYLPPLWFAEGMAEYLSLGPSTSITNAWMRDAALRRRLQLRSANEPPTKPRHAPRPEARKGWRRIFPRKSVALSRSSPTCCTASLMRWSASASSRSSSCSTVFARDGLVPDVFILGFQSNQFPTCRQPQHECGDARGEPEREHSAAEIAEPFASAPGTGDAFLDQAASGEQRMRARVDLRELEKPFF